MGSTLAFMPDFFTFSLDHPVKGVTSGGLSRKTQNSKKTILTPLKWGKTGRFGVFSTLK